MMVMAILFLAVGIGVGVVVGMLLTKSRMLEEKTAIVASRDVLEKEVEQLKRQLSEQDLRNARQFDDLRLQHKEQLEQQAALIREQINNASEQILKKRAEELQKNNTEQLSNILNPLNERLKQMREAVEKNDRGQTIAMERLDAAIKANLKQAKEVGERADKLAQALTGENKTQGNFGELRLRTLLLNMGFEEGVQFEEQATMKDEMGRTIYEEEQGRRMVPDVILHFPDDRDVIIDSKMSLKAFEDFFNAETEDDKARALSHHIASVRAHVKELAHKNYSSYIKKGRQRLDFVLMYVYSESALQLALANDASLWKDAYDQGVVISGSQNLYMMLRVLEMTWRQVRQAENQEEIMAIANEVVNRVQMFYERFMEVDEQLNKTRKAFDNLKTTTSPSGKGIITAASKLLEYGAKENPKRKARLVE
ncbi:MAG: DNA recombination protein RmuC [Prevotella sp.]